MESNVIHIVYYPVSKGYSCYSPELDGLNSEGTTLQELFEKIRHLIEIRVKTLLEIGHEKEANVLKNSEIVFTED